MTVHLGLTIMCTKKCHAPIAVEGLCIFASEVHFNRLFCIWFMWNFPSSPVVHIKARIKKKSRSAEQMHNISWCFINGTVQERSFPVLTGRTRGCWDSATFNCFKEINNTACVYNNSMTAIHTYQSLKICRALKKNHYTAYVLFSLWSCSAQ